MTLMYKLTKYRTALMIVAIFVMGLLFAPALTSAVETDTFGIDYVSGDAGGGEGIVLGNQDLRVTATSIINVSLSLLGIVAVVIILIGGFRWMTAGGNDEKVGEARKWIFSGIIGLAIIMSAWAIARFVLEQLGTATEVEGYI